MAFGPLFHTDDSARTGVDMHDGLLRLNILVTSAFEPFHSRPLFTLRWITCCQGELSWTTTTQE